MTCTAVRTWTPTPGSAVASQPAKEYHKRPVLSARIDADLKAWALAEAKRPGVTLGAVVDEALADLRAKRAQVNHVVDRSSSRSRKPRTDVASPAPLAAANPEQPGDPDCPHPKARVHKGLCGACGTYVGNGEPR